MLTKYEKIINMATVQMAKVIVEYNITGGFCKSDCSGADEDDYDCPHPIECCVKWLNEEVPGDEP